MIRSNWAQGGDEVWGLGLWVFGDKVVEIRSRIWKGMGREERLLVDGWVGGEGGPPTPCCWTGRSQWGVVGLAWDVLKSESSQKKK